MRNENDIRNPKKKYTAQEVDVILTATVKNSGFQTIKSFKDPVTDDDAFTLYTNGSRFIAVFTTANDSTPKKNTSGVIIDKNVTGRFTLDELLKLYKTLISKDAEKGNKDFELIIPLCLCPKDLDDPKHLVYLKIHKTNNQMHAVILDSTGAARYSVENISEALRLNFPHAIIDHPTSFNEERVSSQGINDGPFTIENIRADLQDYEIIEDSHSGKNASELRDEQYTLAQSFFNKMRTEELTKVREQLSPRADTKSPEHGIVAKDETSLENALPTAVSDLQSTISELESWQNTNESKQPVTKIGKHRAPIQSKEAMNTIEINTQSEYLLKLKAMKNMLAFSDIKEKNNVAYPITLDTYDTKKKARVTKEMTIKVPPVIAEILNKIKNANTTNAEQIIKEIRNIANSDATDTKINRWKSSKETKQICARLVEMIDKYSIPQDRPPSPKQKA